MANVLIEKAESEFKNMYYYAFSSVGILPQTEGGQKQELRTHVPHHFMEPFYFILHKKRLI